MKNVMHEMEKEANKLHHLSMRYAGAVAELARGEGVVGLPLNHPGLREVRDLIDAVLFMRSEINALTGLLIEKKVFTAEEYTKQATEEYRYIRHAKEQMLGVESTDAGLHYKIDPRPSGN